MPVSSGTAKGRPTVRAAWQARDVAAPLLVTAAAAVILLWMGRTPICTCGTVKLWHGSILDSGTSQHLTDWYTFSHVIHGFLFYFAVWLLSLATRRTIGLGLGLVLATAGEAGWEILENTPLVIERYRGTPTGVNYFGDSVVNSVADILAMMVGFVAASRLPVAVVVAAAAVMEVGVGYLVRDNLVLNVLMLVYPLEAVKAWQAGG